MTSCKLLCAAALLAALSPHARAQNSNDDAPLARHELAFADGTEIAIEYRQLRLAGGRNLRELLAKTERGAQVRAFYNQRYLPHYLAGKLTTSRDLTLGGHRLAKGSYGFTFRIDDQLVWHFVVQSEGKDLFVLALDADDSAHRQAKRLSVLPLIRSGDHPSGRLAIRYGPLRSKLAFAAATAEASGRKQPPKPAPKTGSGKE